MWHHRRQSAAADLDNFSWHRAPALSARVSADPSTIAHVELHTIAPCPAHLQAARFPSALALAVFLLLTAWLDAGREVLPSSRPFEKRRQANNLSLCPVLPMRRSPSKPNGFPPTGYPPLRQGAEALLTASLDPHRFRTGIEVASLATSKLERTQDDKDRNPQAPDAPRLCGHEERATKASGPRSAQPGRTRTARASA